MLVIVMLKYESMASKGFRTCKARQLVSTRKKGSEASSPTMRIARTALKVVNPERSDANQSA